MDKLTGAKGRLLIPGESIKMVTGNIRFLSSSGFLSQAEATVYSPPQTLLEKFLRAPFATMSFRKETTSAVMLPGIRKHRHMKGRESVGMGLDDGWDGTAVEVSVSQSNLNYLPGRSPNTKAIKVTLSYDSDPRVSTVTFTIPNSSPIPYYDIKPQNDSVACRRQDVHTQCQLIAPSL